MRTKVLTFALCVALCGTAIAQPPTDQPVQPVAPTDPPPPDPEPEPQPPPQPQPQPRRVEPEPMMPTEPSDPRRPNEFSIAIGLGYQLPTSLETPNVTSVRFRLPTGLTFEPLLAFANNSQTIDVGTATSDSTTEIGLGTVVRFPLVKRNRVDLELLGSAFVDRVSTDPEGDDNGTTLTTASVSYGLAVSSWITRNWQLSLSATNPLIAFAKTREEQGPMTVVVRTNTTLGLIFDPQVTLMVHLYH